MTPVIVGGGSPPAGSVGRDALKPSARDMWLPTGAIAQNFPSFGCDSNNLASLSTGRLTLVGGITLPGGVAATSITFLSGTTALSGGTHQWFALYNASTRALLRQTVNDTSAAWAANAAKTLALTSTYTPSADEQVWLGIMVAATTPPNLIGTNMAGSTGLQAITPLFGGNSNTGLTGTAPDPCNAPAVPTTVPYCFVS